MPHPILVCTYTNVAVDNLVEGLIASGTLDILRIGSTGKVKPSLLQYSLDYKMEQHPLYPQMMEKQKYLKELREKIANAKERELLLKEKSKGEATNAQRTMQIKIVSMEKRERSLIFEVSKLKGKIRRDVISKADVVRPGHFFLHSAL